MDNAQFGKEFKRLFKELTIKQIIKEVFEEFHIDDQGLITRFVIDQWEEAKARNKELGIK